MGQLMKAGQQFADQPSPLLPVRAKWLSPVLGLFRRRKETMKKFITKVQKFMQSEDGPTAVEYAIMLALIVIVCLTAIQAVGTTANTAFQQITTDLNSVGISN